MAKTVGTIAVGLCLFFSDAASAGTWYVNGAVLSSGDGKSWNTAFKTIQEGIDASSDADTVLVAEGTYVENIQFNGKNITLTSTDPLDPTIVANTVIDGKQSGSVVTLSGTENETCVLSGFTVWNGKAECGGGISGGTEYRRTHAEIRNNVIAGNSAIGAYPEGRGGGVCCCDGLIYHNTITRNVAEDVGAGLAVCNGTIRNNTVTGNSAREGGGLAYCDGIVRNNVVSFNTASYEGGGLFYCDGRIENDTVYGNSAESGGGGLYNCEGTIRNCILWGNAGPAGQISGWVEPAYSCIEGWRGSKRRNIGYFPYFVDAENGDFHLGSWSPCIDAGDPGSPFSEEPEPNGGRVNVGAYGNTPEAAPSPLDVDGDGLPDDWEIRFFDDLSQKSDGDPDGDQIPNIEEYRWGWGPAGPSPATCYVSGSVTESGDGRSWGTAFKTIQEGIDAASEGDTVIVAQGIYRENLLVRGKNIRLTSTDPLNASIVANTVIDGNHSGVVVTFSGEELEFCTLSGFTIRNGELWSGAGIRGGHDEGTHATIEHNVVTGNTAYFAGSIGYVLVSCDGLIRWNTITNNGGTAMYLCDGVIQNNVITGNSGGGLSACYGTIENNLIAGNQGNGLTSCEGTIQNNTIVGNGAAGLKECGGMIRNCIIWGNTGAQVSESGVPSFCCIQGWTGGGEGNVASDPRFIDYAGGDYRLQAGSACRGAGVNHYWFAWPQRDLDGNCRLAGARVDMGCYEYGASRDADGDLLSDDREQQVGSDPNDEDTDGDGLRDGLEALRGTDPTAVTSTSVIHVPGEMTSIQQALCLSMDGEEIVVAPGTYYGNVQFCGTGVILRSVDPGNAAIVESTILDGNHEGPVILFTGFEGEACVLAGFTIRNGKALYGAGVCGGNWRVRTRATIHVNVIVNNSAHWRGGGVAFCDGTIESNRISGNSVFSVGGGLSECGGLIRGNVITGNVADSQGGGLADCTGSVKNNIICANSSEGGAGLIRCDGRIENNTVYGNSASGQWGGGGLTGCKGEILNCIIWGNTAEKDPQLGGCSDPSYSCVQGWVVEGRGNIWSYPYFVAADQGDFHLRTLSPCIDAGDPASPFENEPEPNGGRIDMGAYGNTSEATSRSADSDGDALLDDWEMEFIGDLAGTAADDPDGDGMANLEEYRRGLNPKEPAAMWHADASVEASGDGRSWATALKTIQEAIQASSEGDTIIVAQGTYEETIRFNGINITLKSTNPLDPDVVADTVIDRGGVTFFGTERESCVLSGFTISRGGGVLGNGTHATIQNNIIEVNGGGDCGGGLEDCDGIIQNNIIRWNRASLEGGGLYGCDGIIQNNFIVGNNSRRAGGGLCRCQGIIQNNIISENVAGDLFSPLPFCEGFGGGLYWCHGPIRNNTIVGNAALDGYTGIPGDRKYGSGGGLYACEGRIQNCIIWGNEASTGSQWAECARPAPLWCGGDPQFVDSRTGDYRLMAGSPCIDAGFNDPELGEMDIAGMHRIMFGGKSLTVDIGAYEYYILRLEPGPFPDQVTLVWSSQELKRYSILYSHDLSTWKLADELPSDGNETSSWIDDGRRTGSSPLLVPRRFYRILENP